MAESDSSSERVRPGLYRTALWFVRLAYACMVFWFVDLVIIRPQFHVTLVWLVCLALALIASGLLRLSGARFVSQGNLRRDIFWLPRR